jgi:hypothetical protein
MDPLRKAALVVLVAGVGVWSPFWVWYQLHFHTRFVGPFYTYSFTFLPLMIAPGLNAIASANGKKRAWIVAMIVVACALTIASIPVMRAMGVHMNETS